MTGSILLDEVVWQHQHSDSWSLLDIEKTMQGLKKYVLVDDKYFQQLYDA